MYLNLYDFIYEFYKTELKRKDHVKNKSEKQK
jgi:hypothetical protein